jgi:CHC2 zinc finger
MTTDANTQERIQRYRGVSYTRPIDEAKRLVPVPDLAEKLSGAPGVKRGRELAYICPLHDDHNPSLRVDPDKGVWFCDPCLVGGDVVELYRLVHGFDQRDARSAAGHLLLEFGHQPPERPPSWSRRQHRQKRTRDLIEEARLESMTRRLWRYVFAPLVEEIEDPEERKRMAKRLWPKVDANVKYLLAHRRGNR